MRALVTGGAGFIGSHLVDALLARGDAVSVVDDLSNGRREQVPGDVVLHVAGTASVLKAAHAVGVRRVLLASTGGALYGESAALPTPEDSPIAPFSPYGASKAAAETYLALYTRLHGVSTMALRFGNVYGPRQDPHGEAGVV